VTLGKTFYSLFSNRKQQQPNVCHILFLTHSPMRPLQVNCVLVIQLQQALMIIMQ
jgi:hypothetical protein